MTSPPPGYLNSSRGFGDRARKIQSLETLCQYKPVREAAYGRALECNYFEADIVGAVSRRHEMMGNVVARLFFLPSVECRERGEGSAIRDVEFHGYNETRKMKALIHTHTHTHWWANNATTQDTAKRRSKILIQDGKKENGLFRFVFVPSVNIKVNWKSAWLVAAAGGAL